MPGHDIIVIGASAGGVEALGQLFGNLALDIPAAIFVVLHIPADSSSYMPRIINRAIEKRPSNSVLKAIHPKDGEPIEHGRIYVAPPDRHLLVQNGYIQLARGPKENSTRPAIDPLFRTAARAYGQRVVGVVLSGTLDDGTAGLMAIKQRGGVAIVQNPDEAMYPGMPRSAIENVPVDRILRLSDIPSALVQLASQEVQHQAQSVSNEMEMEADMASLELGAMQKHDRPGTPSAFACPECGGVLWELDEDRLTRFRCRTGHAYSIHSLLAKQDEGLEDAIWHALRALEEKAALTKRMAKRARERQQLYSTERFTQQAHSAQEQATLLREILLRADNGIDLPTLNGELIKTKNLVEDGKGAASDRPASAQKTGNGKKTKHKSQWENGNAQLSPHSKPFSVVAICASAGELNAISQILSALPADFGAAMIVVQQVNPYYPSIVPEILARHTALDVKYAQQGDVLEPATVYIVPPDQHLLVNPDGTLCLFSSNFVHFARPSADLLLESLAASFKQRAIAVLLTGSNNAMGIGAIKQMGGRAIAQAPESGELFDMAAAIDTDMVDLILPLPEITTNLLALVRI